VRTSEKSRLECAILGVRSPARCHRDDAKEHNLSTEQKRFVDCVALVTGGANGLGRGVAERFAAEGARVWIADIDPNVGAIAKEIGAEAGVVCDVSVSAEIDRLVDSILTSAGRLDVAVANAGIGGGARLVDLTDELIRHILAVNLESVFYTCRAAARAMLPRRSGSIVTVGSVFGQDTPAGSSVYGAAKAGVVALTHALARELAADNIRVNCISPGHMGTELYWSALHRRAAATGRTFEEMVALEMSQVPIGRFGTGEDVAGLATFLASPDAAYLTGQTINIDGGLQPR
jgi:NAD(P)-dependent dehydrogenase (short-subunit alcohol dehydrogenase family)